MFFHRSNYVYVSKFNVGIDGALHNLFVLASKNPIKRTSVQKSNKNEIFMARVKNSNCLKFCTQVDPSKTRKSVYFFSSNVFFFSEKNELFAFTL